MCCYCIVLLYITLLDVSATLLVNLLSAKLSNLNSHLHEVVSRYRDPQLQVIENYSCFLFEINNLQIMMFKHSFHFQSIL